MFKPGSGFNEVPRWGYRYTDLGKVLAFRLKCLRLGRIEPHSPRTAVRHVIDLDHSSLDANHLQHCARLTPDAPTPLVDPNTYRIRPDGLFIWYQI
jgi:hypothetical protein